MGTLIADKLDKALRKALPAEHFAVSGKRKLPINDEHHTREESYLEKKFGDKYLRYKAKVRRWI